MVTKSRMSPFAITKARKGSKDSSSENLRKWFSVIDAATLSKKRTFLSVKKLRSSLLANSKLHGTLYGFVVFEVAWKNVRGISYMNELQTDTSLAIEAKYMRRWEFDSIAQAAKSIKLWYSGTLRERNLLQNQLNSMLGDVYHDAPNYHCTNDDDDKNILNFDLRGNDVHEVTEYKDALLLFRFNDHDLPFELQHIIMSDLRLLTLLEAGLPSWVIFFQSYPVFCQIYRPWICLLARVLYVVISLVTVVIGFYDLYKNIPLLKATAARLCGPLFGWIETWEMVSRIKYLGTVLFLHNSEKVVKWFLTMSCTVKSFVTVIAQPLARPLMTVLAIILPIWNIFIEMGGYLGSFIWLSMTTFWSLVENVIDMILCPVYLISSFIWTIATTILYPIFWLLWGILCVPVHVIIGLSNCVGFIFNYMYDFIGGMWLVVRSLFKLASDTEKTVETYEVSMLRVLWNDLFSKIFSAVRSIFNGFVAFFTACNRHRLSIYNHLQEFIRRKSPVLSSIQRAKRSGAYRSKPGTEGGCGLLKT
ncbi:uncharacterized protein [Rutidosis leptorrhynchoides]|uniref:uncharacterized protein isoform X2 n=1 Tax=Rutidosis leptorrhynchoides TaxID=125765 RepID=UPI003A98D3AF